MHASSLCDQSSTSSSTTIFDSRTSNVIPAGLLFLLSQGSVMGGTSESAFCPHQSPSRYPISALGRLDDAAELLRSYTAAGGKRSYRSVIVDGRSEWNELCGCGVGGCLQ